MDNIKTLAAALAIGAAAPAPTPAAAQDARFLNLATTYTLESDGTATLQVRQSLRYDSHHAFHDLHGETFIEHDPAADSLRVDYCRTTMADGSEIDAPGYAFNAALPRWAAKSADYNRFREMVVSHTALEVGAVAHLGYTLRMAAPATGARQISVPLRMAASADTLTVELRAAAGVRLAAWLAAPDQATAHLAADTLSQDGYTVYRYRLLGSPAAARHALSGAPEAPVPTILATAATGDDAPADLAGLLQTLEPACGPTSDIGYTLLDTALALQAQVAALRTVPAPLRHQNFPPPTASHTLQAASGTQLEKARLLADLLAQKGIKAQLALRIPNAAFNPDLANLLAAEEVGVMLRADGHPIFLPVDALRGRNAAQRPGYTLAALDGQGGLWAESGAKGQRIATTTDISLGYSTEKREATADIRQEIDHAGCRATALHPSGHTPGAAALTTASGAKITSYQRGGLQQQRATAHAQATLPAHGGLCQLQLPAAPDGIDTWGLAGMPAEIGEAMPLPHPVSETHLYRIELPKGLEALMPPADLALDAPFGKLRIEVATRGGRLEVRREIHIDAPAIEPGQWADFRRMAALWAADAYRRVSLRER